MDESQSSISLIDLTLPIRIAELSPATLGVEWILGIGRLTTLHRASTAALIYIII